MGKGNRAKQKWGDDALLHRIGSRRLQRHILGTLPRGPRCKVCSMPFRGVGILLRGTGWAPSRKNPNFCRWCFEWLPDRGYKTEVGVLFADVRGYTSLAETRGADDIARLLDRFYSLASRIIVAHDALVDKFVGDEVMALFLPSMLGEQLLPEMASVGEELLQGVGYGSGKEPWLSLGVGMDHGEAYVGNVGPPEVKDFTALGDVVNTASRLRDEAQPGQLVMTERVFDGAGERWSDAVPVELRLRGKSELVSARVVSVG